MKNFRLAIRSLLHFKLYTVINMLGLALALACVIVILRYVHGELTVDHFHEKADRIYVTRMNVLVALSTEDIRILDEAGKQGRAVDPEFTRESRDIVTDPGIELLSRYMRSESQEIRRDRQIRHRTTLRADSLFLRIMDYPIVAGVEARRPGEVNISVELARQLFGSDSPLGETIHVQNSLSTIVGVIETYPEQSGLRFDLFLPVTPDYRDWELRSDKLLLLYPNQDFEAINQKWDPVNNPDMNPKNRHSLLPLKKVHFSDVPDFRAGNKNTVVILGIVGLLILLVGVVNFINIYTAVVLRRGREFGMKKVFGAPGNKIFGQLWTENAIMIALSLLVALALTELLNPAVKNILGFNQIPFRSFDLWLSLGILIVIPSVTALLPFLRYNYSTPINSLRSVGKTGGKSVVRRIFLAFQYTITLVMIMVSVFFLKQLRGMLKADPGFRTENIIQSPFIPPPYSEASTDDRELRIKEQQDREDLAELIAQKMDASPLFTLWTRGTNPIKYSALRSDIELHGGGSERVWMFSTNEKWMNLFGIPVIDGRSWNDATDDEYDENMILSESVIKALNITDFREAIINPNTVLWINVRTIDGQRSILSNGDAFPVIGVVQDIYFQHLGQENHPVVFVYRGNYSSDPLLASVVPGKEREAIEFLRQLQAETVGGEFTYSFVEDDIRDLYAEDRKVATIYTIFTAIAILVSALGLFSISLFDVQQRFKEIAIRKVNGATTGIILRLLLRRYMILLGISFVIAVPVAWFAIQRYLENFAYKTAVSWWIFALALLITAGVSLLTLIHQTRKAAATNPADVIRSE